MAWLTDPLQFEFMQRALIASLLVSLVCATTGVYVVLRRMSFIGAAIAHTALPGLAVAALRGWPLLGGALVSGLITALGIGWISRRGLIREDAAIGIVFTAMFAVGILVLGAANTFQDLFGLLFGDILGVSGSDLIFLTVITAAVLGALAIFHKELELTSVDPTHAATIGLSPDTVRYGLLVVIALAAVAAIQAVGIVLTSALLVTPAAAAGLIARGLVRMLVVSSAIAVGSSVAGLYASFHFDVASGAAIVLTTTAVFAVTWAFRFIRRRGVLVG